MLAIYYARSTSPFAPILDKGGGTPELASVVALCNTAGLTSPRPLPERGLAHEEKRIAVLLTVALVVSTMMVAMAAPAFAAPQTAQGTCGVGGPSGSGASGCAGNVGGYIITKNQGCRDINRGPFRSAEESCTFVNSPNSGSRLALGPSPSY